MIIHGTGPTLRSGACTYPNKRTLHCFGFINCFVSYK
nr:MAG TPA: hypothetical protein [Caudoviricetes sp.]